MRLELHVAAAVAQAGSCSSDSTPNLGTSICHGCGSKKPKKKKKKSMCVYVRERERGRKREEKVLSEFSNALPK